MNCKNIQDDCRMISSEPDGEHLGELLSYVKNCKLRIYLLQASVLWGYTELHQSPLNCQEPHFLK